MQQSFQAIKQLVADFKAQETAYLSPGYQESQVRQDFIDKFFAALGWDVTHERQKNPYEQEVHIENKVKMAGSSQRRAEYAFYVGPNFRDPKFFVEAKKPSRNLANADDYYQAIRYEWTLFQDGLRVTSKGRESQSEVPSRTAKQQIIVLAS
jgi:adenine-specific DNA-methyltransferase